jgi:hypothetical protein
MLNPSREGGELPPPGFESLSRTRSDKLLPPDSGEVVTVEPLDPTDGLELDHSSPWV